MQLPSIKQLQYLVAVAEYRHFSKAAAACFVSQSAFSIGIKELETSLGAQLVDRTNRSVTITALGKDIVAQARLCLRDLEMLVELAGEHHAPLSGRLQMGVIPTITPFMIPSLLPKLRKAYPDLQLYLKEEKTDVLVQALMAGELDVVLMAFPYELRSVDTLILFQDHFRLAANKHTKLIDPQHYSFNRLQRDSVLLLEDGHCLRDHAISACRLRKLDRVNHFRATSLHTLVQMVDSDLGITFLPEMAEASGLLKHTQVKTWPLKENAYREIGLAWRSGSARGKEFKLLGEFIKKVHSA